MPDHALSIEIREDGLEVRLQLKPGRLPTLFEWFEQWFSWLEELAKRWYAALLRQAMLRELGPRYRSGNAFKRKACPSCGSHRAIRKEWRARTVEVPRIGGVRVTRPYVGCRDCGRSWAPYDEEMGLAPRRRYQRWSLLRPLRALIDMSYARAAKCFPESLSPMTLWRFVQRHQPPLHRAAPDDGTCVLDATLIPGNGPRGQLAIGVAHMIRRSEPRYGRPALQRRVVAAVAGAEKQLVAALRGQKIDTLLHDGRIEMRRVARRPARCRWHVPHMVETYTLFRDGIKGRMRKRIGDELRKLIYSLRDPDTAAAELRAWTDTYFTSEHVTWRYLRRAMPELLRPLQYPDDYTVVSTSPLEREMREINRRMENGSYWSVSGAQSFLMHYQIARYDPERYRSWLTGPSKNLPDATNSHS